MKKRLSRFLTAGALSALLAAAIGASQPAQASRSAKRAQLEAMRAQAESKGSKKSSKKSSKREPKSASSASKSASTKSSKKASKKGASAAEREPAKADRKEKDKGATKGAKASAKRDPFASAPLDDLIDELKVNHRSKAARSLKTGWDRLRSDKASEARKAVQGLLKDRRYGDYAAWITGLAWTVDAREAKGAEATSAAQKALAQLNGIEDSYPGSPLLKGLARDIAGAELVVADEQAAAKRWKDALVTYERALTRFIEGSALGAIPAASLKRYAQSCEHASNEICLAWVQRLGTTYPRGSAEMQAIASVFPSAAEKVRTPGVSRVSASTKATDQDQAAFEEAYALIAKDEDDALKALASFVDTYPRSPHRHRARFWMGQLQLRDKETEAAKKLFVDIQKETPLSWYGLLSSLAAGTELEAGISQEAPSAVAMDAFLQPHELHRLRRAQELLAEGAKDLAAVELQDFKPRDALSSGFLLYLARLGHEAGAYQASFVVISDLISRGYAPVNTAAVARLVFPSPYFDVVKRYASEYQLDPVLVLSLIKQESAFNATVQSSVGATGLMQLMPATALDTDREVSRQELVVAERNIRVGAKYLKQLLNRFKGNIVLALAGYNAGPSAVNRWVRENPSRSMLEFVEAIPYRETRDYVGSIIRNYYWYSKRLGTPLPKDLAYFWGAVAPASSDESVEPSANPTTPTPSPSVEAE